MWRPPKNNYLTHVTTWEHTAGGKITYKLGEKYKCQTPTKSAEFEFLQDAREWVQANLPRVKTAAPPPPEKTTTRKVTKPRYAYTAQYRHNEERVFYKLREVAEFFGTSISYIKYKMDNKTRLKGYILKQEAL